MAVGSPKGHSLSEMEGLSEALATRLGEQWVTTVEEAVAWLAAESGEDEEREAFLAKARELLGENRFAELVTPAPAKTLGCELPDETKEEQS